MLEVTQARANPRALVGAVLSGSTIGLALLAAAQMGGPREMAVPDAPKAAVTVAAPADVPAAPQVIKAGILPEFTSSAATLLAVDPFRGAPVKPFGEANARDLECMTEAVYFESRGQPLAGQQAVAQVVLNRTRHPAYPKTVCGVTYQGRERGSCQFSYACHPRAMRRESVDYRVAREVAQAALDGSMQDVVGTAVSFHARRLNPGWGGMIRVSTIGDHVFYKFSGAKGSSANFTSTPQPSRASNVGSLGSALMAAVKRPIHAVVTTPAVKTATPLPAPVLALTNLQAKTVEVAAATPSAPAPMQAVEPVIAPAPAEVGAPSTAATLQPVSTPAIITPAATDTAA